MSKYSRRDERARAAGWTGYGQQRRAAELGYGSPREYLEAKSGAGRRAVEPNPYQPLRRLPGGVQVRGLGQSRGIAGPWSQLPTIERELGRSRRGDRRVTFHVGGQMFGRRGFSLDYVREQIEEWGSLAGFLEHVAETYGGTDSEAGLQTGGAVSVVVS